MLLEMTKVEFVGPKRIFCEAVSFLHRLGTVDIDEMAKHQAARAELIEPMNIDKDTQHKIDDLEKLEKRLNYLFAILRPTHDSEDLRAKKKVYSRIWAGGCDEFTAETRNILKRVESKVRRPAMRKEQLQKELTRLLHYEMVMEKVQPLISDMVSLEGFGSIVFIMEKGYEPIVDSIDEKIHELTMGQCELIKMTLQDGLLAVIVIYSSRFAEAVRGYLFTEKVNEVHLPEDLSELPYDEAIKKLKDRKEKQIAEIKHIDEELEGIAKDWYTRLSVVHDVVTDRMEEFKRMASFAETEYTFLITGWMPARDFKKNEQALRDEFGGQVLLNKIDVTEKEGHAAPVAFHNSKFAKPYELIMKGFQTPKYGTVDPTPFVAVSFPLFFGWMVGDTGYGLLFLLIAQAARLKWKNILMVRDVTLIFTIAALSSIFFGFIFGEFFGDLPHRFGWVQEIHISGIAFPIDRLEALKPMLFLSIAVGVTHLSLGLIIGVINAIREKSKGHLYERSGFLILTISLIMMIAAMTGMIAQHMLVLSTSLLVASIALIMLGGGFFAIIEVLSFFGNILSYTRLTALGIAGVILALVANKLGGMFGIVWIGIFVAALLHTLNIVLSVFSPSIHALRLNFIEFFGKFFESGGKQYQPFKKQGGI